MQLLQGSKIIAFPFDASFTFLFQFFLSNLLQENSCFCSTSLLRPLSNYFDFSLSGQRRFLLLFLLDFLRSDIIQQQSSQCMGSKLLTLAIITILHIILLNWGKYKNQKRQANPARSLDCTTLLISDHPYNNKNPSNNIIIQNPDQMQNSNFSPPLPPSPKPYLAQNQMGHPERRKIYHLHDRHNLKSTIDMTWLNSLQQQSSKKTNALQLKKSVGLQTVVNKYNEYVDKELSQRYLVDRIVEPVDGRNSIGLANGSNLSYSQVYNAENSKMDRSLNEQIQNFRHRNQNRKNSSHSISATTTGSQLQRRQYQNPSPTFPQNPSLVYSPNGSSDLNAKQMKQLVLRSALDRPEIYQQYKTIEYAPIRNNKPDDLQTYLRGSGRKKYF